MDGKSTDNNKGGKIKMDNKTKIKKVRDWLEAGNTITDMKACNYVKVID